MDDRLLPWHSAYWQHWLQYMQQKRLPQALLISGKAGLGKRHLALHCAAALLCGKPDPAGHACGQCRDCRLFAAGTHPDLLSVTQQQDKTGISVDQIRRLIAQANLKPQFEGYRIIIVEPADALTANAANAFLKYLEEPTERTLVLLLTATPGKLPATLISRCQKLSLVLPDPRIACAWLKTQQPELDDPTVKKAVHLAQGAPLQALEYAVNGVLAIYDRCFQDWLQLANQRTHAVLVAEQWQKWPDQPILSWLAAWLIDLLKCCYQANPQQLSNPCLYKSLVDLSRRPLNRQKLYTLYDLVLESIGREHSPINKQLMLEVLLLQWMQLNSFSRKTHA